MCTGACARGGKDFPVGGRRRKREIAPSLPLRGGVAEAKAHQVKPSAVRHLIETNLFIHNSDDRRCSLSVVRRGRCLALKWEKHCAVWTVRAFSMVFMAFVEMRRRIQRCSFSQNTDLYCWKRGGRKCRQTSCQNPVMRSARR